MTRDEIISFDSLYDSMMKCKKNVSWKPSVQSFLLNDITNISKLSQELKDGTYKESPHKYFIVYEPKRREIMSLTFRDRVYQRSLNDNAIYPQMSKSLIYDNCACQKGKGTDFGRKRLKRHLRKAFQEWGTDFYVLQMDVEKYYPTMSHEAVKAKFKKHLEPEIYLMAEEILNGFPGDIGYNAGSQIIQIAGMCLLDDADHYAKEQLHISYYLRYMDDTIIFSNSKEELDIWLKAMEKEYAKVGCKLNQKKTKIYHIKKGINFLGFDFQLTKTGKVIQTVCRDKVKRNKIKYKKMVALSCPDNPLVKRGIKKIVTVEKLDECSTAFKAHASKGNSHNIVVDLDAYYEEKKREVLKNAIKWEHTFT